MAKSKGAKRGRSRKRKRVAVHIKQAAGKRLAGAEQGNSQEQERPHKRPREPVVAPQEVLKPQRQERDRKAAVAYLSAWLLSQKRKKRDKKADGETVAWKFNKNVQGWILRNMFKQDEMSDSSFLMLRFYLDGLKGSGRERVLSKAREIIDNHGPQDEDGVQNTRPEEPKSTSEKQSKKDRTLSRNVASDRDRGGAVPEAVRSASGSEPDSGGSGSEGERPAPKKGKKAKGGDAHDKADKGRKKRVSFAFSFGDEATQEGGDDDGARSGEKNSSDSKGTSRTAKDSRRSSSSGSVKDSDSDSDSDPDSDPEVESDGDGGDSGDGRESDTPRSKKRRKGKAVKDGLADQGRSQARARAIAVAYERALQVAELLA